MLRTGFGRRDVELGYVFVGRARRIFGDQGPPARRDFDARGHLVRVQWDPLRHVRLTGFTYLLDLENAPAASSNTHGFRITGERSLGSDWTLAGVFSWAIQADAGANPIDYRAHYSWVEARIEHERAGTLTLAFERLGSDGGAASFGTPLGTLHAFNGYADVFLDNGGAGGLRDLFVRARPRLPWRFSSELAAHHFWSDDTGRRLGWEIDALLSRPIGRFVTALAKLAYYDSTTRSGPPDTLRVWFQVEFAF